MSLRGSNPILPLHDRTLRHAPKSRSAMASGPRMTRNHHHAQQPLCLSFVPNRVRNEAIAFIAELWGTFLFLFFAFGATQVANAAAPNSGNPTAGGGSVSQAPDASTLQYISLAFGFSLAANVWIFFRISGGLFNPVVSLALWLVGAITATRAVVCFIAQIVGSICAAAVVAGILPGPLTVNTSLGSSTSITQGLFLEMFLTTELTLAILFLAAEKQKSTFLAPIGIGLALFVAELMGVYFTGGSLNPARSFGPAVVTRTFDHYHWIYWLGPTLGACLATGFYKLMKYGEYETVNPGQDFNDHEAQLFKPPEDPATAADVARPDPMAQAAAQVEELVKAMIPDQARSLNSEMTFNGAADEATNSREGMENSLLIGGFRGQYDQVTEAGRNERPPNNAVW